MYDEIDSLQSLFFTLIGLLALFGGMWLGKSMGEPNKIKDKNCIIYNQEIYCKENVDENKEISNN